MKNNPTKVSSLSRRQFIIGTTVLIAGIRPLCAIEKPSPNTITVDLHSHAYLDADELDTFKTQVGPDVAFLSGHPSLGTLPGVFEDVKKWNIPVARTPDDIFRAKSQGQRVAIIANEGGYILNGKLSTLEELNTKGLVSLQLVRTGSVELVDSDHDLTPFGKDVIRAQNRLGMIVDLAHAKSSTIEQAAEISTKPIMLSHVNRPVEDVWNVVAESGGVIGNWWHPKHARNGMTFSDWIDDFARMADAVGVDAIGVQTEMGTDIHRGPFDSYKDWNQIGKALLNKGFNREETDKILGGNFMRMFAEIAAGKG